MKTVEIDARGLACPQPVVLTRNALAELESGVVMVYVGNETARDNVKRMAENEGCAVMLEGKGSDGFTLHITKIHSSKVTQELSTGKKLSEGSLVYLFESDYIGRNRELGKVLVNGFLNAITSLPKRESRIIFISNGVRLTTKGSYVLDTLLKLKESGFDILICGTCLDFLKIRDKVQIGTISNALEIMEALTNADKVIKF
jgi:selenium metabolism protein YedF